MSYRLAVIFSFAIAIAAIIGFIRFKKIDSAYYPFLFCIWLGLFNEILGNLVSSKGISNSIYYNIYDLAEAFLVIWQFKNWGIFKQSRYFFPILIILVVIFWLIESVVINKLESPITYFRIFYSFIIVLLSINTINEKFLRERKNILKNSIFLITTTFVIFYTYSTIVGIFWLYDLGSSLSFAKNVTAILIYVNLFSNLIFALAVLWMPTKHRFSLPS